MANCDKFQSLMNQNKEHCSVSQLQTAPESRGCRYCGIPGHSMQECRKFKALFAPGPRTTTNQTGTMICFKCGTPGHRAAQCRNTTPMANRPQVPTCEHCHKRGHSRQECYQLNGQQASHRRNNQLRVSFTLQQQPRFSNQLRPPRQNGPSIRAVCNGVGVSNKRKMVPANLITTDDAPAAFLITAT